MRQDISQCAPQIRSLSHILVTDLPPPLQLLKPFHCTPHPPPLSLRGSRVSITLLPTQVTIETVCLTDLPPITLVSGIGFLQVWVKLDWSIGRVRWLFQHGRTCKIPQFIISFVNMLFNSQYILPLSYLKLKYKHKYTSVHGENIAF